jgi:hypothetical protein
MEKRYIEMYLVHPRFDANGDGDTITSSSEHRQYLVDTQRTINIILVPRLNSKWGFQREPEAFVRLPE